MLNKAENALIMVEKHPIIFLVLSALLVNVLTFAKGNTWSFIAVIFLVVLLAVVLKIKGKLNNKALCATILILGFLIRVCYILYTDCTVRQHDVESFGCGYGHAGYIEYIYNNFKLPVGDVRDTWQFYHPPFSHIISALFMRVQTLFGVAYSNACESLQILSLIYSNLCVIVSYKILNALNLKCNGRAVGLSLVAFSPTFIIFSGSINNDVLSVLFMLLSVLYSIRWYYSKTYKDIVVLSVVIGLGMFTKLSVWMVAPPIAVLFFIELISAIKKGTFKTIICQYSLFAIICLPIGLYWSVRNLLLYNVPLNYIPMLDTTNAQYVGGYSVVERLFNFKMESVFINWGNPFFEFNPTLGLLKTSFFGESLNWVDYPQILVPAMFVFVLGCILALIGVILFFKFIKTCKETQKPIKIVLVTLFLLSVIMYYYFCFSYPFTCTQNIRYASHLIPLLSLGIAYFINKQNSKIVSAISALFCISSAVMFLSL